MLAPWSSSTFWVTSVNAARGLGLSVRSVHQVAHRTTRKLTWEIGPQAAGSHLLHTEREGALDQTSADVVVRMEERSMVSRPLVREMNPGGMAGTYVLPVAQLLFTLVIGIPVIPRAVKRHEGGLQKISGEERTVECTLTTARVAVTL